MFSEVPFLTASDEFYCPPTVTTRPFHVPSRPGWDVWCSPDWVFHRPCDADTPHQGWKIHVSAVEEQAQSVLSRAAVVAQDLQVSFKYLPNREKFLWRNSKNCDRRHAGKFIAFFPTADQLPQLLPALEEHLGDTDGPYILSDRRWKKAPIFLRYGVFRPYQTTDGPDVRLRDPHGHAVEDSRSLTFTVPDWAPIPPILTSWLPDVTGHSRAQLPFTIDSAISFSNAGGIYRGTYESTEVVVKEARPHAGLDRTGTDAVTRLDRERIALTSVDVGRAVPTILYAGHHWEHHYLVETCQPGVPMQIWSLHGAPHRQVDDDIADRWARSCQRVLASLRAILDGLHQQGWAHLDIHPGNVLVDPDTMDVSLIDFENALPIDAPPCEQPMAALGFGLRGVHSPCRHDHYGLTRIAATTLWISRAESVLEPDHLHTVLRLARQDRTHPWLRPGRPATDALLDLIESITHDMSQHDTPLRPVGYVRPLPRLEDRHWEAVLRRGITDAVDAHHQPGRRYPVHHRALTAGWTGLGSGAAVIDRICGRIPDIPDGMTTHLGLMDGLVGDLLATEEDHPNEVQVMVDDRLTELLAVSGTSVHSGLPGVLLGLVRLHAVRDHPEILSRVVEVIRQLARDYVENSGFITQVRQNRGNHPRFQSTGLLYGNMGLAWLFYMAREVPGVDVGRLEDACAVALRREFEGYLTIEGRMLADQGRRGLSYVATGSAGWGLILPLVPDSLWPPGLAGRLPELRNACDAPGAMFPGLFNGYAGLVWGFTRLSACMGDSEAAATGTARLHRCLERQALGRGTTGEGAMVCGDGCRLTADLATGNAGILVALRGLSCDGDLLDVTLSTLGAS
ncbi:putative SapB synthase [Austwickia sp. TVS 96-490-7B]|uniref:class III lanthionine synthetase LanKC N-terminal domain-containing protein n=1 Tax=Austwickia sp. TVS 96-490-7B TaxID=2830843 RepID=UPI001C59240C|nr:phosphotransferase [Austwickia sp. TVS 96-490-7B]MBW3086134.1 putative SapB synthase [Austwickia sp. TVS 96-490-7B]